MKQPSTEAAPGSIVAVSPQNELTRLRRSFFALGAVPPARYGVEFDHVIEHLWRARCRHGRLPLRGIVYLEDLIHAIGCLGGRSRAWSDLRELHERPLIRQCLSRIEEADAIVFVRRFLSQLQQRCSAAAGVTGDRPNELDEFIGDRPLRSWLGELLSDALTGGVAVHRARQTRLRWPFRHLRAGLIAMVNPEAPPEAYRFPVPPYDDSADDDDAPLSAVPSSD
jgi:hypothetical protein